MEKVIVYDKAKYHYEEKFRKNLPRGQAYIHRGMFVAWLALNNLLSEQAMNDFEKDVRDLLSRTRPPSSLYTAAGGVLTSDMLPETGNEFTRDYFDLENEMYLEDYENVLCEDKETILEVEDTWGNYDVIADRISQRFEK